MAERRAMRGRGRGARRTRRQAVQGFAAVAGGLLLARAVVSEGPWAALAQGEDEDSSGRGRGRGRGRGGDGERDDEGDDEGQVGPTAEIPPGSAEVRIVSDDAGGFVPGELTIDAGQAVTFVNTHSDEHTATGAGFDTGIIAEGSSATVVLDEPGVYFYACQIHPVMTGSIAVRGADGVAPQQAAAPAGTPAAGGAGASVSIANLAFNPDVVTVQAGQSVSWSNDDSLPHTVTALDGLFDSGILDPGATFAWTFEAAGEVAYQCQLHPNMQGSVIVEGNGEAVASPAAATGTEAGTAAPGGTPEGVWLVEFVPDDTSLLAAHEALLAFHPDGLVQADFAVMGDGAAPEVMLRAGHGEWRSAGDGVAMALLALLVDGEERFVGTVTIRAQVQVNSEGGEIAGMFAFTRSLADGQTAGEGTGDLRGAEAGVETDFE